VISTVLGLMCRQEQALCVLNGSVAVRAESVRTPASGFPTVLGSIVSLSPRHCTRLVTVWTLLILGTFVVFEVIIVPGIPSVPVESPVPVVNTEVIVLIIAYKLMVMS